MQITDIPKKYTVTQAVNRLINRFKSEKIFVKQEDLNALKEIAIAMNFLFSNIKKNDNLYFKLGCKMLLIYLQHYKSWKVAVKQLKADLEMPIEFYEKMIYSESMSLSLINYQEKSGDVNSLNDEDLVKFIDNAFGLTQSQSNRLVYDILSDLFLKYYSHEPDKH